MPFYNQEKDSARIFDESEYRKGPSYRSSFRRDLDRLIHSTCFRRLQGKTQLYPGFESDFFRNRLTHSIEVAQIARSIAAKINFDYHSELGGDLIDLDLVEFAGLAHDLGHPPFGHQGEEMLDLLMREFGGFEGNAQTLRILTRIEKKGFGGSDNPIRDGIDERIGLNLTARSLASILKYENPIAEVRPLTEGTELKPIKGYYNSDQEIVDWIKEKTGGALPGEKFKTIECRIMDIADDIAYSTYDLEDALKAGFYTLQDVYLTPEPLREAIASQIHLKDENGNDFQLTPNDIAQILQELIERHIPLGSLEFTSDEKISVILNAYTEILKEYSVNGYARSFLTSSLVNSFIDGIEFEFCKENPAQSTVSLNAATLKDVEALKKFTYNSQILSSRLKIAEYRGKDIVETIFKALTDEQRDGHQLLPTDFRENFDNAKDKKMKMRIICDFVAGMTDRYAIEFYGRLKSENPETIFKPL